MKFKSRIESRFIIAVLFSLSMLATGLTAWNSYRLNATFNDNISLQENRTRSIVLADELRQSSDDLTNFARLYAVTEDPYYKTAYYKVLSIRDGESIRPAGYEEIYWDLVNIGGEMDEAAISGRMISMDSMMLELGMDSVEFDLMQTSKVHSDSLAKIEEGVFSLIESNPNDWKVKKAAREMLFDHTYLVLKAKIMLPIKEFYKHVDERTTIELAISSKQANYYLLLTIISACVTFFMVGLLRLAIYQSRRNNNLLLENLDTKNTYLEHAAKIIRHDMHSGINTYIPRGIRSLERRLKMFLEPEETEKIKAPMKMLTEGLDHTQKVYQSVYAFTNLVKKDAVLETEPCDLKDILNDFLKSTSYKSQVRLDDNLHEDLEVNKWLFCTALDNLIRNGLKYNDSDSKEVHIYQENGNIIVRDNGRGLSMKEFIELSKPYTRKEGQKEQGTGLGLNICTAILEVHGFSVRVEDVEVGTKIVIEPKR